MKIRIQGHTALTHLSKHRAARARAAEETREGDRVCVSRAEHTQGMGDWDTVNALLSGSDTARLYRTPHAACVKGMDRRRWGDGE